MEQRNVKQDLFWSHELFAFLIIIKKKRNWVLISTLQRLLFVKLTRSFAQLASATLMFISECNFHLRAVRKGLNVMVIGVTIWLLTGQCRRLACVIRQYNLYGERCCRDYWFHFLVKTSIVTFIFKRQPNRLVHIHIYSIYCQKIWIASDM